MRAPCSGSLPQAEWLNARISKLRDFQHLRPVMRIEAHAGLPHERNRPQRLIAEPVSDAGAMLAVAGQLHHFGDPSTGILGELKRDVNPVLVDLAALAANLSGVEVAAVAAVGPRVEPFLGVPVLRPVAARLPVCRSSAAGHSTRNRKVSASCNWYVGASRWMYLPSQMPERRASSASVGFVVKASVLRAVGKRS